MLEELKVAKNLIVGAKRTLNAAISGMVIKVFIAKDAEERVIHPIIESCTKSSVEIEYVESMSELGKACGIDVGAAVAALVNN